VSGDPLGGVKMVFARARIIVALATAGLACAASYNFGPAARGDVEKTSLVAILADPARFDGKRVWVSGVVNFEFEGDGLFLTRDHHRLWLTEYGVWLSPNLEALGATPKQLSHLNGRFVLLEGEVAAACHGHLGAYEACIGDVTQIRTVD
jgi:hypothetical protein